jgi:hypothetical protein
MQLNNPTKQYLLPVAYLLVFFAVYFAFTNSAIYHATLGHVVYPHKSWNIIDQDKGEVKVGGRPVNAPYTPIATNNINHWDAGSYRYIGEGGYFFKEACAFFPLFPLLYKAVGFSPLILVVNFLLFSFSLIYLYRRFINSNYQNSLIIPLLMLALPTAFVYVIPYSEALFFFCFTIAIVGFINDNKYLLFIGLILAATTRPIISIVLLSLLAAEFIRLLQTRSLMAVLRGIWAFVVPMFTGTAIAAAIQYSYTGSLTMFIKVQEEGWNHTFRIPTSISDWSDEGHAMNMFSILFVVLPALLYCGYIFYKAITTRQLFTSSNILKAPFAEKFRYLLILSAAYVVGSFCFIFFFQGGSLNGMFRYVMCSPFFYLLLFAAVNSLLFAEYKTQLRLIIAAAVLSMFFGVWVRWHYHRMVNTVEVSYFILGAIMSLFILYNRLPRKWLIAGVVLLAFAGIVYQTYLLNSFVENSWILT